MLPGLTRSWLMIGAILVVVGGAAPAAVYAKELLFSARQPTASNDHTTCQPTPEIPHPESCLFLPFIAGRSFTLIGGSIKLKQGDADDRAKGLTIFSRASAILDVSELHFSIDPEQARACLRSEEPCLQSWRTYSTTLPFGQTQGAGIQEIKVEFRRDSTVLSQDFTFFYIPNGDFLNDAADMLQQGWQFTAFPPVDPHKAEPPKIEMNQLVLRPRGVNPPCSEAIIGNAIAGLTMQLPPHSDYRLHVEGDVYTQDQNPSNSATYDAFEIAIDGHVVARYSNQETPILCSNPIYRRVPVNAQIPLHGYGGEIVLSLENHLRYDNYFNTYTVIKRVWIDK